LCELRNQKYCGSFYAQFESLASFAICVCICVGPGGRSPAEIVGSNPAGAWMFVVSVVCCQVV